MLIKNKFVKYALTSVCVLALSSCGSSTSTNSGSSTSSSSSVAVNDLAQVPSLTSMLTSSTSANISSPLFAVSGTPTSLVDIDSDAADTLFWNGLIADVNTNGASSEDIENYFNGEGKCRVAQMIGFSFQNIETASTSICYLKNAPTASSGVTIDSGDTAQADIEDLFAPTEDNRVVKVQVRGNENEEEGGNQDIYIQVFGSDSTEAADGYAVDMWFCEEDGTGTATGYESIRVNTTDGTMTASNVSTDFGNFISNFSGTLTEDEDGNITFDSEAAQSVTYTYQETGEANFIHKGYVSVEGETLTSKEHFSGSFGGQDEERKTYSVSSFTGSSLDSFGILSAGVRSSWVFGDDEEDTFYGAMEFQDTLYNIVSEGTLYDTVEDYAFSSDSFFGESGATIDSESLDSVSDYSCSVTPDAVVTMDFSDSTFVTEISSQCESSFNEMNFCDGQAIQTARSAIFAAESQ